MNDDFSKFPTTDEWMHKQSCYELSES